MTHRGLGGGLLLRGNRIEDSHFVVFLDQVVNSNNDFMTLLYVSEPSTPSVELLHLCLYVPFSPLCPSHANLLGNFSFVKKGKFVFSSYGPLPCSASSTKERKLQNTLATGMNLRSSILGSKIIPKAKH